MEIKKVAINEVRAWKDNPRSIKTKDFQRLKKQIKELGVYKPLIAFKEYGGYTILGGNMRLLALQELGFKEVDISVIYPKSEAEKIKYAISDNDRAGGYDLVQLAELVAPHIDEINLEDYKIDTGEPITLEFISDDLSLVLDGTEDEVPEINEEPAVTKTGQLFNLGRHRLICGDAMKEEDVRRLVGKNRVNMVFADPPYGMGLSADFSQLSIAANKKGGRYINGRRIKIKPSSSKYKNVIGDEKDYTTHRIYLNSSDVKRSFCGELIIMPNG